MNDSKTKPLFWCAIIAQVVGAQVFFWDALPDYQELTAGASVRGTPRDFAVAVLGLVIMQSAYWYAHRLQPEIRFRSRVALGHVLLCVSKAVSFLSARWRPSPRLIIGSDLNSSCGKQCCWFLPSSLSFAINVPRQCGRRPAGNATRARQKSGDRTERSRQTMRKPPLTSFGWILPVSKHQVI